jgi:hypothetical protein
MSKPAKKKPAKKRSTKPADTTIEAKRAEAYLRMEPHLCDCVRWVELADDLSLGEDRPQLDMVIHHATAEMRKLLEAYNEMGGFEL